jgi:cell division septation protein DedD
MEITCPNCEHKFFATTRRAACANCSQEFDVWAVLGAVNGASRYAPEGSAQFDDADDDAPFAAAPDEILDIPAPAPAEESTPEPAPVLDESFSSLPPEAVAAFSPPKFALATFDDFETERPRSRNWMLAGGLAAILVIAAGGYYLLGEPDSPGEQAVLPAVSAAAASAQPEASETSVEPSAAALQTDAPNQPVQDAPQQSDEGAAKAKSAAKSPEKQEEKSGPSVDAAETQPATRPRIVGSPAQPPGNFAVQVASRPSEAEARTIADRLRTGGASARVVRAELASRGVWYRVQVGSFETRAEAERYGAQLKRAGTIEDYLVADLRPR